MTYICIEIHIYQRAHCSPLRRIWLLVVQEVLVVQVDLLGLSFPADQLHLVALRILPHQQNHIPPATG